MKLGLHITNFTWPGGPSRLGADLGRVAESAEAAGFERLSVMDHLWQTGQSGGPEFDMLEAYTTLGYLAARTSRIRLLALVTGVVYREPGLLAKMVTTLDVLSAGRAMLGIGAAWYEAEARGLGLDFPPVSERFERLEEALQICLQMWSGDETAYDGAHYRLERLLNVPAALTSPHPPIVIGGGGEQKTLRLVARYAQGCNLFSRDDLPHKLEVLREHCEREGRDYDDIEKTVFFVFDVGEQGEGVPEMLETLRRYADLGFSVAHGNLIDVATIRPLEIIGEQIVPEIAGW